MENISNTNSTVYVDMNALTSWSSQMNDINESAILVLNSLVSAVRELDDYWAGNIATGFLNDSDELIQRAKKCHNQMKDVPTFLMEVVNRMNNQ